MKNSALILFIGGFLLGASNIRIKELIDDHPFFFGLLATIVTLDCLLSLGETILRMRKVLKKKKLIEVTRCDP